MFALVAKTILALLPICNPLGNAAIFLSMTDGDTPAQRRQQALKGAFYMFLLLTSFTCAGTYLMHFFGISLDGIRIAGGLVVARVGLQLLSPHRAHHQSDTEHKAAQEKDDISFSPLALPLLAGPGAIAVVMGLGTQIEKPEVSSYLAIGIGIATVCTLTWLTLRESSFILRFLGVNGANALTRIMGFLLLAIAVQFIIEGSTHIIEQIFIHK